MAMDEAALQSTVIEEDLQQFLPLLPASNVKVGPVEVAWAGSKSGSRGSAVFANCVRR